MCFCWSYNVKHIWWGGLWSIFSSNALSPRQEVLEAVNTHAHTLTLSCTHMGIFNLPSSCQRESWEVWGNWEQIEGRQGAKLSLVFLSLSLPVVSCNSCKTLNVWERLWHWVLLFISLLVYYIVMYPSEMFFRQAFFRKNMICSYKREERERAVDVFVFTHVHLCLRLRLSISAVHVFFNPTVAPNRYLWPWTTKPVIRVNFSNLRFIHHLKGEYAFHC